MGVIAFILIVLGFGCFLAAAFWTPNPSPRVSIGWLGLAFWILSEILTRAGSLSPH